MEREVPCLCELGRDLDLLLRLRTTALLFSLHTDSTYIDCTHSQPYTTLTSFESCRNIQGSEGEVLGEDALDEVDTQSHCGCDQSIPRLSSEGQSGLLQLQLLVDLHHIQPHQPALMGHCSDDMITLHGRQSSSKLSPGSESDMRVECIDIERNMKGFISSRVQILDSLLHDLSDAQLDHVVHGEALHFVFLQVHPFVLIDVPNTDQDDVFVGHTLGQPHETRDGRCESGHVGHWVSVVILVGALLRMDEIWVCVHPDDFQVFIVAVESVEGGCAY